MSKVEDYIFPLENYLYNPSWEYEKQAIFNRLNVVSGISPNVCNVLKSIFSEYITIYADAGFNVIPIFNDDESMRVKIMLNYFLQEMLNSNYLLSCLYASSNIISIESLEPREHSVRSEDKVETYEGTKKKIIEESSTDSRNSTNKSMVENAPYNNSIDSIDSPSGKNHSTSIDNNSFSKNGDDTTTDNNTNNSNLGIDSFVMSPEIFGKYIEVFKEYDIHGVINKFIRKFLYEFNRLY